MSLDNVKSDLDSKHNYLISEIPQVSFISPTKTVFKKRKLSIYF